MLSGLRKGDEVQNKIPKWTNFPRHFIMFIIKQNNAEEYDRTKLESKPKKTLP